jgi:hypothetical protein
MVPLMRQCGKILYIGAGQGLQYGACALHVGIPKATDTHSEYVILIAFPLVARTRLDVTLCVHVVLR